MGFVILTRNPSNKKLIPIGGHMSHAHLMCQACLDAKSKNERLQIENKQLREALWQNMPWHPLAIEQSAREDK